MFFAVVFLEMHLPFLFLGRNVIMLNLNYQPQEVVETEGMPYEDWLKYRTTGIGGSDVSAIYEVSGWTTKRALYYAKRGLDKGEASNQYTLDFGHHVEPFVAQWFKDCWERKYKSWLEKRLNVKIKSLLIYKDTIMYRHPLFPFMQANLDYRCHIETVSGKVLEGIFECKTTSWHIGSEKWNDEKVPLEYELQCRHYMAVMNLDFTIIACLWGNNETDYRARVVKRDLDLEEEMIYMEKDFWENNVLAENPPKLSTVHAKQEEDAFKSYKIADRIKSGEITEIDTSDTVFKNAVKSYLTAQERRSALSTAIASEEDKMTLAKTEILTCLAKQLNDDVRKQSFALSDANNVILVKNNRVDKSGFDTARFKEDYPEIYEQYKKVFSYRKFSVEEVVEN